MLKTNTTNREHQDDTQTTIGAGTAEVSKTKRAKTKRRRAPRPEPVSFLRIRFHRTLASFPGFPRHISCPKTRFSAPEASGEACYDPLAERSYDPTSPFFSTTSPTLFVFSLPN